MRIEFLIDTPNHKRWMLPDNEHYYNSVIYGDEENWSVWRKGKMGWSDELVVSGSFKLDDPQWQDLSQYAQALAEKKFSRSRKDVRHVNTPLRAR